MNKEFVFVFTVGGKLVLYQEIAEVAIERGDTPNDVKRLKSFVNSAAAGDYCKLETGEVIFRCV